MGVHEGFAGSIYKRIAVLIITIFAASVIVTAKEGYQQKDAGDSEKEFLKQRSNLEDHATLTGKSTVEISERIWGTIVKTFTNFAKSVAVELFGKNQVYQSQGNYTCHKNVCFFPEYGLGLEVGGPVTPDIENTTFLFFSGPNSNGTEVTEETWQEFFTTNFSGDISRPLVAIVHGLNGTRRSPWAVTLRKALFENMNCNVLVADWEHRAKIPYYAKAASSSLLVGVLLSRLLQTIIETSNCSLHPDNVHAIGFSLGAHAAGVCGRHFYNYTGFYLGRITGLDPAGPLFEHSNVSLSFNDAQFVDVIHTNAGNFSHGSFGLNESIGHVDFYPNGGSEQPGCDLLIDSTDPGCSHKRAQIYFIQSLYRNCSFTSYYCKGGWKEFQSGACQNTTNSSLIGEMGFYSINKTGRENQYLATNDQSPFCINKTKPLSAQALEKVTS